jgi:hypothetical protein
MWNLWQIKWYWGRILSKHIGLPLPISFLPIIHTHLRGWYNRSSYLKPTVLIEIYSIHKQQQWKLLSIEFAIENVLVTI